MRGRRRAERRRGDRHPLRVQLRRPRPADARRRQLRERRTETLDYSYDKLGHAGRPLADVLAGQSLLSNHRQLRQLGDLLVVFADGRPAALRDVGDRCRPALVQVLSIYEDAGRAVPALYDADNRLAVSVNKAGADDDVHMRRRRPRHRQQQRRGPRQIDYDDQGRAAPGRKVLYLARDPRPRTCRRPADDDDVSAGRRDRRGRHVPLRPLRKPRWDRRAALSSRVIARRVAAVPRSGDRGPNRRNHEERHADRHAPLRSPSPVRPAAQRPGAELPAPRCATANAQDTGVACGDDVAFDDATPTCATRTYNAAAVRPPRASMRRAPPTTRSTTATTRPATSPFGGSGNFKRAPIDDRRQLRRHQRHDRLR